MTDRFRRFNSTVVVPASMVLMLSGFVALCQPWSAPLHRYSVAITLLGLVLFTIFARVKPPAKA